MIHKFSYEHNTEHNRSKIRILHPKIIGKIHVEPNYWVYANLVIKIIKSYANCDIFVVVMGIILSMIGKFFEHCSRA